MSLAPDRPPGAGRPNISIVMPCYDEQDVVGYTIPRLVRAFERAGYRPELVAVDNGSSDRTGEIIRQLATQSHCIRPLRVELNEGYGHGVLSGLARCTADWVCIIPADGQVDAEDVVRLYEAAVASQGPVLAKVRRRFRMDGLARQANSLIYNALVALLWPGLGSFDLNGSPKILPRRLLLALNPRSKGWLLDPEIMIKAHYLGVRILEFNVFARARSSGISHVRLSTSWEFLRTLLAVRMSGRWQREVERATAPAEAP